MLAAHGATKISAYVTHGIFPNRSWERFERDNGGIACPHLLHFQFLKQSLLQKEIEGISFVSILIFTTVCFSLPFEIDMITIVASP